MKSLPELSRSRNPILDYKPLPGVEELGRMSPTEYTTYVIVRDKKTGDVGIARQTGRTRHKVRRDEIVMTLSKDVAKWLRKNLK